MKKWIFIVWVAISGEIFAQNGGLQKEQVVRNMLEYVQKQPQEKVYLHTDRDHYDAGDRVWLRAYVTDAVTHCLSQLSRYVYAELIDRRDSVLCRVKIPWRDSSFYGYLPLGEELPQGDYFVRAYTYWMQNAGDDYLFRKKIRVVNPRSSKVSTRLNYEDTPDGKTLLAVRFCDSRQKPYAKVRVEYEQNGKVRVVTTDEEGEVRIRPDTADFPAVLPVSFKDGQPFVFNKLLYPVNPREDFDVAFFPEGGHLLAGNVQTVAFKALGNNGLSRAVKGIVYNDRDEQIGMTQSLHRGMGSFDLPVAPGRRYYAVFTTDEGEQKRFDLPRPESVGLALKVAVVRGILSYAVLAGDSTVMPEGLYILMHCGGVPLMCEPLDAGRKGRIALANVPEGILHIVLMDMQGEVYSERLCFVRKEQQPEIGIETDKPVYRSRDLVNMDIQVSREDAAVREGSFSLSVMDDSRCERDTLAGHILSALLLTSDLKGYVEEPAWYFRDNRVATRRCLDLLMLTHGWTRFRVNEVMAGKLRALEFYVEQGQAFSGKVNNLWGKPAANASLVLAATNGLTRVVSTDQNGHFAIDRIAFPDSTDFVLQAMNQRGRQHVEVTLDREKFLRPSVKVPYDRKTTEESDAFYRKFMRDYYYDHGVKIYVLDEAMVKRKATPKVYSFYDNMTDDRLDSARLVAMGDLELHEVLEKNFPSVEFRLGDTVITRLGRPLHVLVNNLPVEREEMELLRSAKAREFLSISLILPPTSNSLFGSEVGALIITTNNAFRFDKPRHNILTFSVLGYQKKAEFYVPRYEVDSVRMALADTPDRRVTVYWNPVVRTDASGKVRCSFTTSDSGGPYTVVLEGILRDGTICRKERKIILK